MFDPISSIWIFLWLAIGSYGTYLSISDDKNASRFYVYGKSLDIKKKGLFWDLFLLPKRYFLHFYMSALIMFLSSFYIIYSYYTPNHSNHDLKVLATTIKNELSKLPIKFEKATSIQSITSLTFTVILMTIQVSRRLYETIFISVYSSNSKINIIHYLFGHLFYLLAAFNNLIPIMLSETSSQISIKLLIDNLINRERSIIFVLFIYASIYQNSCHKILANLRKDKSGNVITEKHYVPSGSLFEFVTCPHFLTEVIIYLLIIIVQKFESLYWNLTFLLVLTTQTINAINEHKWYKKKYKEYPKSRKAIFPCLL